MFHGVCKTCRRFWEWGLGRIFGFSEEEVFFFFFGMRGCKERERSESERETEWIIRGREQISGSLRRSCTGSSREHCQTRTCRESSCWSRVRKIGRRCHSCVGSGAKWTATPGSMLPSLICMPWRLQRLPKGSRAWMASSWRASRGQQSTICFCRIGEVMRGRGWRSSEPRMIAWGRCSSDVWRFGMQIFTFFR